VSRLLKIDEAAEYLAVSPNTVRNLISEGSLIPVRVRADLRIELDEVERYIAALKEGSNNGTS
jgi:excisionase family DNA binding protein